MPTGSSVVDDSVCLDAPSRTPRPEAERRCDILCPAATLWQPADLQQLDISACRAAGVLCRSQSQDTAPAWTCAAPQGASFFFPSCNNTCTLVTAIAIIDVPFYSGHGEASCNAVVRQCPTGHPAEPGAPPAGQHVAGVPLGRLQRL